MAKILIVDDDQYIRDLYEEVLKDEGFSVDIAQDGKIALARLTSGGYDVVLLDVNMPELNGLQVLKELSKVTPKSANKMIILLTNLAQDPIVQEALQLGASSYLIKTDITPDKLLEEVKKHVSK